MSQILITSSNDRPKNIIGIDTEIGLKFFCTKILSGIENYKDMSTKIIQLHKNSGQLYFEHSDSQNITLTPK